MTEYIAPKKPKKVEWSISQQTLAIVEYYAEYCDHTEDDVVDTFLKNLLGDPSFAAYLRSQRRKQRFISKIFLGDASMSLLDRYGVVGQAVAAFNGTEITEDEEDTESTNSSPERGSDEQAETPRRQIRRSR